MKKLLKTIFLWDLLIGLKTTLKHIIKEPITVQYPKERVVLAPYFRGHFRQLYDKEGNELCNACALCAMACPTKVITVEAEGKGADRKAAKFTMNIERCMYCNLCVEVCPKKCIVGTDYYEYGTYNRDDLVLDKEELFKEHKPRTFKK